MKRKPQAARKANADDLLTLARRRFLANQFENIEMLADELHISRATAYKWVGNSEQLLSRVLVMLTEDYFAKASRKNDRVGAERVKEILLRVSKQISGLEPYRRLLRRNPDKLLRIVSSRNAAVQAKAIELTERLLSAEIDGGTLRLPFDVHTMAYILIRICESFLQADLLTEEPLHLAKEAIALTALLGSGMSPRSADLSRKGIPREIPDK